MNGSACRMTLMACLTAASLACGADSLITAGSWFTITPAQPHPGDSVTLEVTLSPATLQCIREVTGARISMVAGTFGPSKRPCRCLILEYTLNPTDSAVPCDSTPEPIGLAFELGALDSGLYLVIDSSRFDPHAPFSGDRDDTLGSFWMRPPVPDGSGLGGQLVDIRPDSLPIAGARVRLESFDVGGAASASKVCESSVSPVLLELSRSDGDGSFGFRGLHPGIYQISFSGENYHWRRITVELRDNWFARVGMVSYGTYGAVGGTVTAWECADPCRCSECERLPVAGATVRTLYSDSPCTTVTDTAGSYLLQGVEASTMSPARITVSSPMHLSSTARVDVSPLDTVAADFVLVPVYRHAVTVMNDSLSCTLRSLHCVYAQDDTAALRYAVRNVGADDVVLGFDSLCGELGSGMLDYSVVSPGADTLLPLSHSSCSPIDLRLTLRVGDSLQLPAISLPIPEIPGDQPDSLLISSWVRGHRAETECRLWVYLGDRQGIIPAAESAPIEKSHNSQPAARNGCITLHLRSAQTVETTVFGLDGRLISRMRWGRLAPGYHELALPPAAGSAVSIVRIRTAEAIHHLLVSRTAYR